MPRQTETLFLTRQTKHFSTAQARLPSPSECFCPGHAEMDNTLATDSQKKMSSSTRERKLLLGVTHKPPCFAGCGEPELPLFVWRIHLESIKQRSTLVRVHFIDRNPIRMDVFVYPWKLRHCCCQRAPCVHLAAGKRGWTPENPKAHAMNEAIPPALLLTPKCLQQSHTRTRPRVLLEEGSAL